MIMIWYIRLCLFKYTHQRNCTSLTKYPAMLEKAMWQGSAIASRSWRCLLTHIQQPPEDTQKSVFPAPLDIAQTVQKDLRTFSWTFVTSKNLPLCGAVLVTGIPPHIKLPASQPSQSLSLNLRFYRRGLREIKEFENNKYSYPEGI